MNNVYFIPTYSEDYDEYGFGSWLKSNIGNIAQTVGGAALLLTSPITGPAGLAGAGMLASGIGGFGNTALQTDAEKQAEKDAKEADKQQLVQNRLQGLTNSATIPTFKKGGHLPEGRATLKEAKEYAGAFPEEMKMGEEVEYEHTGNPKLAKRIAADHIKDYLKMTGTPGYYSALKESGISDELNKMADGGFFEYKNGGIYIKPEKRGSFTAWAKKHGMGVQEAAKRVMANKENYSSSIVKKANFAKNFAHALGGDIGDIPQLSTHQIMEYGGPYGGGLQIDGFAKGGKLSSEKAKEILRDGTVHGHKLTPAQKRYFGWVAGGSKKPDGGKVEPVYPRQYGKTVSLANENYLFQPNTEAQNNYYYPENILNRAAQVNPNAKVLPTFVGYSPGWQEYTDRTDMPPAGYRTVNGSDTTFTYRKEFKTPTGRDTVAYVPGTRRDVMNAMYMLNNPGNKDALNKNVTIPSGSWAEKDKNISEYYNAVGIKRPLPFASGGSINNEFLTEYKTGGTHEQNPYGGIPVGSKARVEQGEYRFDDPETGESYIFSNRF